ncbi:CapA family protein [Sinosporangium siamense]|uniref:Poly-gamma-glutamate biosynthesis protein n=1 Tax=Sinosporangium siamense TaxID=1367973 RepID=A0A919RFJ2_9ACTN|nr:CapA family protein [Sinosporangium siamense]GII92782.1 poly-gamma-glutamate biosynthesis protein [Sinosporangium siamense]
MTQLITATGDIVLTKSLNEVPADPRFTALQEILRASPCVLSSVELPFSDKGHPSDRLLNFRARPELAGELAAFNLRVATLANNHSSDYGWSALADTVSRLRATGVTPIGAGETIESAQEPAVIEVGGRSVGIVAWSCLLPLGMAAGPAKPGISPIHVETEWVVNGEFQLEEPGVPPVIRTRVREEDLNRVLSRVRRLRSSVDFVVVTLHWGFGFGAARAEYQRVLGRLLVDAGADVVLGHHVHAPQGVESYRGKVIVYSPGNFVAQQPRGGVSPEIEAIYRAFSKDAFVSVVEVDGDGPRVSLVPIMTNDSGLPVLADSENARRIAGRIAYESAELDTKVSFDGTRIHVH